MNTNQSFNESRTVLQDVNSKVIIEKTTTSSVISPKPKTLIPLSERLRIASQMPSTIPTTNNAYKNELISSSLSSKPAQVKIKIETYFIII